ncbi:hypothetical protein ACQ86O_19590 [Serratia sp. L9]|uniref:hypothetical protein n=1 Tax=Serratia sp. L9 TaxID=3423946 RepID=UPI003D67C811
MAFQTPQSWLFTLKTALKFAPEELFLYPLYVRPLTGIGLSGKSWDDERAELYQLGRDYLLAQGYEQISMRMFRRGNTYQRALVELSHVDHVEKVVFQTNLSCRLDFLQQAQTDKIALWVTYHPDEVALSDFIGQCNSLIDQQVRFSVGGWENLHTLRPSPHCVRHWHQKSTYGSMPTARAPDCIPILANSAVFSARSILCSA